MTDVWRMVQDARDGKHGGGTVVEFPYEGIQALVQSLVDQRDTAVALATAAINDGSAAGARAE